MVKVNEEFPISPELNSQAVDVEVADAVKENLTQALVLARHILDETDLVETVQKGLEETNIEVVDTHDLPESTSSSIGKATQRTYAEVVLAVRISPEARRRRLIAMRIAANKEKFQQ